MNFIPSDTFKRFHTFIIILGIALFVLSFYLWVLIGHTIGNTIYTWIENNYFQAFLFDFLFAIIGIYLIFKGIEGWKKSEEIRQMRDIIKLQSEFVELQSKIIEYNKLVKDIKKSDEKKPYKEIPPLDIEKLNK
jgi:uncharacterized membrane protein required for colicin V production